LFLFLRSACIFIFSSLFFYASSSSSNVMSHRTVRLVSKSCNTNCMGRSSSWEADITQPIKKFYSFYGTRILITVFTRARHWPLSLDASCIFPSNLHKTHSNIIVHQCLGLRSPLPFRFSSKMFMHFSSLSHAFCKARPSHPYWFDHLNNVW
jgi:hypothetical protein